jgi:hypothetical protein
LVCERLERQGISDLSPVQEVFEDFSVMGSGKKQVKEDERSKATSERRASSVI